MTDSTIATPSKAGRPKSAEKRAQILDAASKLFLQNGITNTSMDLVASQSGVSKQTVYSHFSNKDALYLAVIDMKCQEYTFSLQSMQAESPAIEDVFAQLARQFIRLMLDDEVIAMYRVVIGESKTNPHVAEMFFEAGPKRTIDEVSEHLVALSNQKISEYDARQLSVDFFNLLKGDYHMCTMLTLSFEVTKEHEEELVVRAVDYLIGRFAQLTQS